MGIVPPRPPLPASAGRDAWLADLRRIEREIARTRIMTGIIMISSLFAAVGFIIFATFGHLP